MTLLQLRDVSFAYRGSAEPSLHEITLDVAAGQLISLVGPNGSGKSTLLKLLARIQIPSAGQMLFQGTLMSEWDRRRFARAVGYLSQHPEPDLAMKAVEVVLSGRSPHLGRFSWETSADLRIAMEALEECDASHLAGRELEELSGGEQKRVFLARVLAGQPELILLDEPLAALDPSHVAQFVRLLRSIADRGGRTIIFVSHDLNWSVAASDRILVLHQGRLVADTTPSGFMTPEILRNYFDLDPEFVCGADGVATWLVPRAITP